MVLNIKKMTQNLKNLKNEEWLNQAVCEIGTTQ